MDHRSSMMSVLSAKYKSQTLDAQIQLPENLLQVK